ncbi:PASTA domain-containing protein [Paenibacillus larvae]|uniref:PASTA domain-containing protein n=1 Tax=Paenibacillus larvae TaxID=1464 RepID=UPI00227FB277|nr:PASTA domain-containing protein [Paenibacillus larvae]MCY9510325.1 PASTA domain-containing protein [Paenibacillus larvae]MCY9524402.1 PASTA domain-containing protein [Paenibacillus larvae]
MDIRIDDRYLLFKAIQPLEDGVLYNGQDLFLKRDVFLYLLDKKGEVDSKEFGQSFGQASRFTNEHFFHILNAGVTGSHIYVVFKAYNGNPLAKSIHQHTLRSLEILTAVFELGKSMQDAMEEQIYGFSVTADNIWLTEDKQLKIMNYWSGGEQGQTGSLGLSNLLYQLFTYSRAIPPDQETYESNILPTLQGLRADQREALLATIRRVFRGEHSLSSFVLSLREILLVSVSVEQPTVPVFMEEPKKERPAQKYDPKEWEEVEVEDEEDEEEEYEAVPPVSKKQKGKPKRQFNTLKILFIILVFCVVFVLVFAFLLSNPFSKPNKTGFSSTSSSASPTESVQPSAKPTNNGKANPASSATPKPTPANSQTAAGTVPNLIGMTKQEAEKAAIAAGLRYKFVIEPSDQPDGTVFKQDPAPGTPAKKGDSVSFTVSKNNQ